MIGERNACVLSSGESFPKSEILYKQSGEAKSRNFSPIFTVSYSNITHYSTYCTYVHTVPRVTYSSPRLVKCNNRMVHLRMRGACMCCMLIV